MLYFIYVRKRLSSLSVDARHPSTSGVDAGGGGHELLGLTIAPKSNGRFNEDQMTFELTGMGIGVSEVEDDKFSDTDSDQFEAENSSSAAQHTSEELDK